MEDSGFLGWVITIKRWQRLAFVSAVTLALVLEIEFYQTWYKFYFAFATAMAEFFAFFVLITITATLGVIVLGCIVLIFGTSDPTRKNSSELPRTRDILMEAEQIINKPKRGNN